MHILITNDDGPPSPHSSPYVATLVSELKKSGHTVSVCLPHTQRSWIGKAHMIGQSVKPLYFTPSPHLHGDKSEGTTRPRPATTAPSSASASSTNAASFDADKEWVLVDGTPASCVQIGLHHFFSDRGPIDLVISGPNYGRNTTAVFALSSGTLGGALEAAVCGKKAIALSFAFFSRNHDPVIIEGAARHGVRVIEKLYADWPSDGSVDLYSVNVPLVEGVEGHKTFFAGMLQNYWREGSCFHEIEGSAADDQVEDEEERIREGEAAGGESGHAHGRRHFKWAPRFGDVYKSVDEAEPGNDGWAVKEGYTSVTPLKANFWHAAPQLHEKELVLTPPKNDTQKGPAQELAVRPLATSETEASASQDLTQQPGSTSDTSPQAPQDNGPLKLHALIDYEDDYVQPLILEAIRSVLPDNTWVALDNPQASGGEIIPLAPLLPDPTSRVLQIVPYESIDFEYAVSHPTTALVNSYVIRKALIRKHYLSATVENWVTKNPDSVLTRGVKRSEHFEVDYAEFLDDALVEAFDLRESMDRNVGQVGSGSFVGDETAEDAGEADRAETQAVASANSAADREWWILKPGMSDRGQGIKLFSTMDELQCIFDTWEEERPDSDDGADDEENEQAAGSDKDADGDYITTSHLRHFIVQPYIHPPLLLAGDGRKFHIRTYVLATGCLKVYVFSDMLALFAEKPYSPPWESGGDLNTHLTNTCLQPTYSTGEADGGQTTPQVRRLRDLVVSGALSADLGRDITRQIKDLTGDLFEAAARGMPVHFQPQGNGFEVFGVDFLVDESGGVWLLEVNAFPDFKQTGRGGERDVVAVFWKEVVRVAVGGFFGIDVGGGVGVGGLDDDSVAGEWEGDGKMVLVRDVELGRR